MVFAIESALTHTRFLSVDIGKRRSGTEGETRAAAYIVDVFQALDYRVSRHEFTRKDGGVSSNIVARFPSVDYTAGYVVVGGHYDTFGESPGANDNASGTGVVMALAESLADNPIPVEFVAFAAEERHPLTGSHHEGSLALAALADPAVTKAMISVDMVASGPKVVIVSWRGYPKDLEHELAGIAASAGIPYEGVERGDISDHTSYARRGIPSAFLWTGDHPSRHTATDTFEIVQRDSVEMTGRLVMEWLRTRYGFP